MPELNRRVLRRLLRLTERSDGRIDQVRSWCPGRAVRVVQEFGPCATRRGENRFAQCSRSGVRAGRGGGGCVLRRLNAAGARAGPERRPCVSSGLSARCARCQKNESCARPVCFCATGVGRRLMPRGRPLENIRPGKASDRTDLQDAVDRSVAALHAHSRRMGS
jgi:hypothetical protein